MKFQRQYRCKFKTGDRVNTPNGKGTILDYGISDYFSHIGIINGEIPMINHVYSCLIKPDKGSGTYWLGERNLKKLLKKPIEFKIGDRIKTNAGKGTIVEVMRYIPNIPQGLKVHFDEHGFGMCTTADVKKLKPKKKLSKEWNPAMTENRTLRQRITELESQLKEKNESIRSNIRVIADQDAKISIGEKSNNFLRQKNVELIDVIFRLVNNDT